MLRLVLSHHTLFFGLLAVMALASADSSARLDDRGVAGIHLAQLQPPSLPSADQLDRPRREVERHVTREARKLRGTVKDHVHVVASDAVELACLPFKVVARAISKPIERLINKYLNLIEDIAERSLPWALAIVIGILVVAYLIARLIVTALRGLRRLVSRR